MKEKYKVTFHYQCFIYDMYLILNNIKSLNFFLDNFRRVKILDIVCTLSMPFVYKVFLKIDISFSDEPDVRKYTSTICFLSILNVKQNYLETISYSHITRIVWRQKVMHLICMYLFQK